MAKVLKVKDPKTGEIRPMTEASFRLAGEKRGFKIVGEVEQPKTEMEKLKDDLRAKKAADDLAAKATQTAPPVEQVEAKKKPGPKPSTK